MTNLGLCWVNQEDLGWIPALPSFFEWPEVNDFATSNHLDRVVSETAHDSYWSAWDGFLSLVGGSSHQDPSCELVAGL
jgi:hypothetical protein